MASTNYDTDRKRRRPPAWDPPKLLLVVDVLNVVVGISCVVGHRRRWRLAPGLQHLVAMSEKKRKRGKRGSKQPGVLIQSTRKQESTLYMHGYMCKEAISMD